MMNLRILAGRAKNRITRDEGKNIGERAIEHKLIETVQGYSKVECFDIGAGADKDGMYTTVDISGEYEPDIVGDMRCLFAPTFTERVDDYPDLQRIPENGVMLLKFQHIIEHVEWMYQEFLFEWAHKVLAPGGMIYIATPNLAYYMGVYYANREFQKQGKPLSYPISEHTYLKPGVPQDMQRWFNFKAFSGGSPGDNHKAALDRLWLHALLKDSGFEKISICDGSTLKAIAYKPGLANLSAEEAVRRVTQPRG